MTRYLLGHTPDRGFQIHDVVTFHTTVRPDYSLKDANLVMDWLTGNDRPLNIVARSVDPFDPRNRRTGLGQRKGLAPIADKE